MSNYLGHSDDTFTLFPFDWKDEDTSNGKHEIQVWCLDRDSNSALLRINYPIPYYIELPELSTTGTQIDWNKELLIAFTVQLTSGNRPLIPSDSYGSMKYVANRAFFRYLQGNKKFFRITFNSERDAYNVKKKLSNKNILVNGIELPNIVIWETNVETIHKFIVEKHLKYASWFKIKAHPVADIDKISYLEYEYTGQWDTAEVIPDAECLEWQTHPRVLSFDIEARSINKAIFPNEYKPSDIAFMISCTYEQFQVEDTMKKYSIVLGDCYAPEGTDVIRVYDEYDLCIEFAKLLHKLNIDILIGHNILKFDYKYLNQRLRNLGEQWPDYGGRLKGVIPKFVDASWSSSNTNTVPVLYVEFPGRISFDSYNILKSPAFEKLPSYSLNNCAKHYLGSSKVDVSYAELFAGIDKYLQARTKLEKCIIGYEEDGTPRIYKNISNKIWKKVLLEYHEGMLIMKRLTEYCDKDAELVLQLFNKLNIWFNSVTSANIIQVKIKYIYTKGQQYKGFAQLYAMLKDNDVVMDSVNEIVPEGKYQGALNLGKLYGITGYLPMVFMLDVNSMYPSIIIGYNICRTTEVSREYGLVHPKDVTHHEWTDDKESSYDIWLVKPSIHEGFLPRLSKFLLDSRGKVKVELGKCTEGTLRHIILNGVQTAYKIAANSLYGVLGSSKNPIIPFKHGAALVTKIGRDTLLNISEYVTNGARITEKAKEEALANPSLETNKNFKILNYKGRLFNKGDLRIVYGDTDSVAIQILAEGVTSQEMIKLSKYFSQSVNDYIYPLGIKPEKYGDLMIETAKKYIFHSFDEREYFYDGTINPAFGKYSKYMYVGMELVRRNNANILKTLLRELCDILMREPMDPRDRILTAIDTIFTTIHQMLGHKIPIEDYIIYQGYNTESDSTPMGVFSRQMANIGKPIQVGERVPFVYVNYPGESTDDALGLKMRSPDSLGPNERIDVHKYILLCMNAVDLLVCARFKGSAEYGTYMEEIIPKMTKHLDSSVYKGVVDTNTVSKLYLQNIKENLSKPNKDDKLGIRHQHIIDKLPTNANDLKSYHKTLASKDKSSLTRAMTVLSKSGIPLILNNPTIISNILLAESLGKLEEYTWAIVSKECYRALYGVTKLNR